MYNNILVPTDGSESAEGAVEHGIGLAKAFDATLHVLVVVETKAQYILTLDLGDELEEWEEWAEELASEVSDKAAGEGVSTKPVVRRGNVAEEIVDYADDNEIDNIVMGAEGLSAVDKYLVGSTAEKVVRTSTVPVTTIRIEGK